jgi:hypothetical protein
VVHELGVDELVNELKIALRVDLCKSATDQPLVALQRHRP